MTRWLRVLLLLSGVAVGLGTILVVTNPAPRVPGVLPRNSDMPYVVKLHAQWCPVCMVTKSTWTGITERYAGRVRFVVLDFTSERTRATSRVDAVQLGLGELFDEYVGETGTILVVEAGSKRVTQAIHGSRDPGEYDAAIDAAIRARRGSG